jgi:penicillin-binding protein 2
VLAAVSAPRFSLQELLHPSPAEWAAITSDPRQPFFHRATSMTVAPGSVFKAITAVALLESGSFDPDAHRHCQGFLDRPDQHRCYTYRHFGVGHGDVDLSQALCRSCNVYFFQGARKIGPGPLVHWAERFGIGQATGIDLPGEQSGNLPRPPVPESAILQVGFDEPDRSQPPWYPGDTLGLAIGQSRLTTTPLQMARVMAAIANDGFLVTPHLLQGLGSARQIDGDPSTRLSTPPPRPIPDLTQGTLGRVREGLEMVVAHPQGTGYKSVRMSAVKIAGKTGTAEVGGGLSDHAWFAGYVPADRPKYAFAVVLEHAGSGGSTAGPVAKRTVETLLELGLVN